MAKTRLLLDTCAVIDLITSLRETDVEFWDIYDDPDTMPYASFETARGWSCILTTRRFSQSIGRRLSRCSPL